MIRAFLAVDLPETYRSGLAAVQDYLKKSGADVRWTSVAGIHLTLKFFGEIEENQVDTLAAAASDITCATPAFTLGVQGVGTFPGPRNPRVIWLGLSDQTEILAGDGAEFGTGLCASGLSPGKASFYAASDPGPGSFQPGAGGPEPCSSDRHPAGLPGAPGGASGTFSQHLAAPGRAVYPIAPDRFGRRVSKIGAGVRK